MCAIRLLRRFLCPILDPLVPTPFTSITVLNIDLSKAILKMAFSKGSIHVERHALLV